MFMKTTFSIIKADVGGWPGHALVHPDLENIARKIKNSWERVDKKNVIT